MFELFDESKRAELEQRNRQNADALVLKKLERELKLKMIEENKAVEEAKNKKGGKAPAPKPKDPKKAAQEQEERRA